MSAALCLALAVYYEARSESVVAQAAVAQVVMQRVESPRYPNDVCAVVKQGPASSTGMPVRGRCQFSFWCDGLGEEPHDYWAWRRARAVASRALAGYRNPALAGVLYYHTVDVRPVWSASMRECAVVGRHVFLEEEVQ